MRVLQGEENNIQNIPVKPLQSEEKTYGDYKLRGIAKNQNDEITNRKIHKIGSVMKTEGDSNK
jgi:hypothetical protein